MGTYAINVSVEFTADGLESATDLAEEVESAVAGFGQVTMLDVIDVEAMEAEFAEYLRAMGLSPEDLEDTELGAGTEAVEPETDDADLGGF